MKFLKQIVFFGALVAVWLACAMQCGKKKISRQSPQQIVLSFDLDDVLNSKEEVGKLQFAPLAARAAFWHPYVLTIITNFPAIKSRGKQIAKTLNGASNIVHEMIKELDAQGYGDLSYYEDEIVEKTLNPKPIDDMVENVKKVRQQVRYVIAATNQDYKQHLAYRKKMRETYGIDLNQLFDAVLVTRVNHMPVTSDCSVFHRPSLAENIYIACHEQAYKPHAGYFRALQQLADEIAQGQTHVIHTDDDADNVQGARDAGIDAIQFKLRGGSARETKPEDIQKTIAAWKDELKDRTIIIE